MDAGAPLLALRDLRAGYGQSLALDGVCLEVRTGEIVCLLGPNGAGKTTTMMAITGLLPGWSGRIELDGADLARLRPHQRVERGIALVPEGRQVFPRLSVRENLLLGAFAPHARRGRDAALDRVCELFPRLRERTRQLAGLLSGGEQQMLAIGRALMSAPRLLMLDEPSLGLAPKVTLAVYEAIAAVAATGLTILLVEQNTETALEIASRGYVLAHGRIVAAGESGALRGSAVLQEAFLGLSASPAASGL